jgi:Transposase
MYVDESILHVNGKTYKRYLLRESYREGKKVKHRTIANISKCTPEEIAAIRLALRHKKDLTQVTAGVITKQGLSIGALWVIHNIARQLGIDKALGSTPNGKLALWQVIARVMEQGSRLSAVRLASRHAVCEVLGLESFDEDDLYNNLDWLCENQARIEDKLFKRMPNPGLFLYDVTSSYLEGTENELSAFGYNRDGKKGKRQIVIGLLCNEAGVPLSIEVFTGNTNDSSTFASQIKKVIERFGSEEVTFVGDRGMIKSKQIEDLQTEGFHYITAITKPQIETLLNNGVIQIDLFDQGLAEVKGNGIRYVLRRNPQRAQEIRKSREDRLQSLGKDVEKQNKYLSEHAKAKVMTALIKLQEKAKHLNLSKWVTVSANSREVVLSIEKETLNEEAKLDGCYVLKSDLSEQSATAQTIHGRYKDLSYVEWAFRSSKTVELELRPIHVRLATRTRGHVFVVMLAYRIIQELAIRWQHLDITVEEGIKELCTLCVEEVSFNGVDTFNQIPHPRESVEKLIDAAHVTLPHVLPSKGIIVTTKRKLTSRRIMK